MIKLPDFYPLEISPNVSICDLAKGFHFAHGVFCHIKDDNFPCAHLQSPILGGILELDQECTTSEVFQIIKYLSNKHNRNLCPGPAYEFVAYLKSLGTTPSLVPGFVYLALGTVWQEQVLGYAVAEVRSELLLANITNEDQSGPWSPNCAKFFVIDQTPFE